MAPYLAEEVDEDGKKVWRLSKLVRKAVLNDFHQRQPSSLITQHPVDVAAFEKEAKRILKEVEEECGWMYETLHVDGKTKGKINYMVWSDVFVCPQCTKEVVFWDVAVNKKTGTVGDSFACPHCSIALTKRSMDRAMVTMFDGSINDTISQAKQVPVLIEYTVKGEKLKKRPDSNDIAIIDSIDKAAIPYWFPCHRMMKGKETRRNDSIGLTHVHLFTQSEIYGY